MKKARAQQLPQPFHNKTSQAEGLHQDPQEAAQPTAPEWPKPDFKPDLAKLSGFGKLFTCKCWLSERVQRQPPANTAFPRASESSLTITKTYKVTIRLLLSLRFVIPPLFFFPWGFGTAPQSSALQRLSRAVSAFCLLKPPNQSLRWEGLGAPAVLVNAHSPQLLFMWPRQSHAIRAIPSPPVQTWLWQLFQLQGHHISLPGGLFFLRGGGCFGFGLGFFPPLPRLFQMLLLRSAACQDAWRKEAQRCVGTPAPAGATNLCRQAGRQPLLGFLFLIGTHPPEGHHISFITRSHLRDVCHKLTGFPTASFKLALPQQPPPCRVLCKVKRLSQRLLWVARAAMNC